MMTLDRYRVVLDRKRAELSAGLRDRDGIVIEKSADTADEVRRAAERELAVLTLNRESNLLRDVESALDRIEDGSYGICLHCDDEIHPKRLEAAPWARYCIRCQEAADQNEFEDEPEQVVRRLLADAA